MTPSDAATLKTLKGARALIADRECWIQGVFARKSDGRETYPELPEATCFCAIGAVRRARVDLIAKFGLFVDPPHTSVSSHLDRWVGKHHPRLLMGVASFNDDEGTTHADVLRMFDETIAELEARAS